MNRPASDDNARRVLKARFSNSILLTKKSTLTGLRLKTAAQEPHRASKTQRLPPAKPHQVIEACQAVYDDHEQAEKKPPNVNEAIKEVRARLERAGYYANWKQLKAVLKPPESAVRRLKPGQRWRKRKPPNLS